MTGLEGTTLVRMVLSRIFYDLNLPFQRMPDSGENNQRKLRIVQNIFKHLLFDTQVFFNSDTVTYSGCVAF